MSSLLLVRHAKSAWPDGVADADRPLTRRGERAAQVVGRFLAIAGLQPTAVIASPAVRARETARLILRGAGCLVPVTFDERIYDDDVTTVIEEWATSRAGETGETGETSETGGVASERLLVVGHEPGMMRAIVELAGAVVALPTATLVWLELSPDGAEPATVRLVVPPRLLEAWSQPGG